MPRVEAGRAGIFVSKFQIGNEIPLWDSIPKFQSLKGKLFQSTVEAPEARAFRKNLEEEEEFGRYSHRELPQKMQSTFPPLCGIIFVAGN